MSRVNTCDWEEDFPNEAEFWLANARRAMQGKRGTKALADLREALLHLPERRLVSGALSTASLRAHFESEPDEFPSSPDGTRRNWDKEQALAAVERQGIGVCAVGAYCWWQEVKKGVDPEVAMASLPVTADVLDHNLLPTISAGQQAGLTSYVAGNLADLNDETFAKCTPEQRYVKILAWLDKTLATS